MRYVRLFGTPRLEDDDGVVSGRAAQRHPVALLDAGLEKANFGRWVHTDPDPRALHDHAEFRRPIRPQNPGSHPSY